MSDNGEALAFDALLAAEKVTGHSYKEDRATSALGFAMHTLHVEKKRRLLSDSGDTHFSSTWDEQMGVFADLGFAVVLEDEFTGRAYDPEPAPAERFVILWHPDGILGKCESYNWTGRNTAVIYYNVRPHDRNDFWHATSSGRFHDGVWVGDHDVREGLRFKLDRLRSVGEFVSPWIERPFLWLLTYAEPDEIGYDYRAITEGRLSRLPAHVREAVA